MHAVMVESRRLWAGSDLSDLVTEDTEAWESTLLLALVLGNIDNWSRAGALGLWRAEHSFVGLKLELESTVTVCEEIVLGLGGAQLLLGGLILLLEGGDQLLELHAADLRLQLL